MGPSLDGSFGNGVSQSVSTEFGDQEGAASFGRLG